MAISFGGEVRDQDAGSNTTAVDSLRTAIARLNAGQPKAALDHIHDAVFEICEHHSLNVPF
jgi:hypothetical protein